MLDLIRTADEVYVFPVTFTYRPTRSEGTHVTPHGDYKHLRPLGADARRSLKHLLGKEGNWFHGNDSTLSIVPIPRNVGFIFRKEKEQLVLLCRVGWKFEGTFNGEPTAGSLEEKASDKFDQWKKQNAQPELGMK